MGLIPFVERNDSLIELLAEGCRKILHPFRVLSPSTAPLSTLAPELRGWPVIVLSNNDGCAIVRTAEAKALGIKIGDPWHLLAKKNDTSRGGEVVQLSLTENMSSRHMGGCGYSARDLSQLPWVLECGAISFQVDVA